MKKEIFFRVHESTQFDAFGTALYNYQIYFAGISNWSYMMMMTKEGFTHLRNALQESHLVTKLTP